MLKNQRLTTVVILTVTLAGILAGIKLYETAILGLALGAILFLFYGLYIGFSIGALCKMMLDGVKKASIVLVVMSLIGMLSASWMQSGTIPTMMIYGFRYLSEFNFIVAAFLITSVISMVLGTSLGTIGTIGIPLVEIGKAMGVPLPLIAGVIVSGAYLGDRSSPMSSSANLLAAITESKLLDMLKGLLKTAIPVYILSMIIYYILGKGFVMTDELLLQVNAIKAVIEGSFSISWILIIPPILIFLLILFKLPIIYCMLSGLMAAVALSILQGQEPIGILSVLLLGFHPEDISLAQLLSGGGLYSMRMVIMIITISTALNGLLEGMGLLQPFINDFIKGIKSSGQLIMKTSLISFVVAAVTCNQSLAIIMPGRFLKGEYEKRGIPNTTLARAIADSGVVTVALIPWNVNAVAIASILKLQTLQYLPFALLCYLLPLATVVYGYIEHRGTKGLKYSKEKSREEA